MLRSYRDAVVGLADRMALFVRAPGPRILLVTVSQELRRPCLDRIMQHELHPDGTRGFILLEHPFFDDQPGWLERARAVREQHERRRAVMREAGDDLDELGDSPAAALAENADPARALAAFGAQLAQLQRCLRDPLTGWVVVVAPTRLQSPARLGGDMDVLLGNERLADLRWIVVETGDCQLKRWASGRKDGDWHSAQLDPTNLEAEVRRMMQAATGAPSGCTSHALMGAAWPAVAPPARRQQASLDEAARRMTEQLADGNGVLDFDRSIRLRNLIAGAALDVPYDDRKGEVLQRQREAVALLVAAGSAKQAAVCETILAGYHLRYDEPDIALTVYASARARAEQAEAWDVAVAAELGRVAIFRSSNRPDHALTALSAALQLGQRGAMLTVRLEVSRQSAELAAERGLHAQAHDILSRAVAIAREGDADEVRHSCAGELARALAEVHRQRGKLADAEAMMDLAEQFEQPAVKAAPR